MKNFPALCVDNFYEDPDKIRDFALSQKFTLTENGRYPGKRTDPIYMLKPKMFDQFCEKLFSIYYDFGKSQDVTWRVETNFQLIEPYSADKNSYKNVGWIHQDVDCIFAGIIYLNPSVDRSCGTSIFELKPDCEYDHNQDKRKELYDAGIEDGYEEAIKKHNDCFVETIRFDNAYNRLVSFDGKSYHGANNFFNGDEPRLTQVFFVYEMYTTSFTPLDRMRKYNVE
jgi:hypothetical protein